MIPRFLQFQTRRQPRHNEFVVIPSLTLPRRKRLDEIHVRLQARRTPSCFSLPRWLPPQSSESNQRCTRILPRRYARAGIPFLVLSTSHVARYLTRDGYATQAQYLAGRCLRMPATSDVVEHSACCCVRMMVHRHCILTSIPRFYVIRWTRIYIEIKYF